MEEVLDQTIQRELTLVDYWKKERIFERSVETRPKTRHYVFYDGPPFATGLPHYGHLLGSTLKDVIPRFWTMKGYRVERVWGWDCHGLPIENIVEKELQIQGGKKGIDELGIDKFCAACRSTVLRFDLEWQKFISRIGRFVDMEHSYKTMDNDYIESVWWGFKSLWEKGKIYEGRRVILYCSRCATPLSDFEIAMDKSYQDVEDDSLYVKFEIRNHSPAGGQAKHEEKEYLLAWTTTPWTLPGNVALAVDAKADYVRVKVGAQRLILASSRLGVIQEPHEVTGRFKGRDLVGLEYEPLYRFLPIGQKRAYYVTDADFVNIDEGTGAVHTAVMYGADDYRLGMKIGLPAVPMLSDEGKFLPFADFLAGKFFKTANPLVIEDLRNRGLLYKVEKIVHSYPFCYRCDTPLFYNAVPAWFVDIQKIKSDLVKQNEKISWHPEHFKNGQFKNILESSPDWNVSRSRYWGNPMPVWICAACGEKKIIGSVKELVESALGSQSLAEKIKNKKFDLHRPYIDEIKLQCRCGGIMNRIPEVFDCWVESGSMPFAAKHYPFENKKWFEENYPADFIGEYSGQVRAWFNVLHRISVGLFGKPSFKNVSVTGVYLGTDGKKMSKSRKNFPDPMQVANKYGVDALRFYMMGSSVMKGEDVIISEASIKETRNQFINIFYNCFNFLRLYDTKVFNDIWPARSQTNSLDRWIISRTENLVVKVSKALDGYDTVSACLEMRAYVSDLSTWYLRRSRDRLRDGSGAKVSRQVLAAALIKFSKVAAPIIPFVTEFVYRDLTGRSSVHLEFWPKANKRLIDNQLESQMELVREIVEKGHAARKDAGIKIPQPLAAMRVISLPQDGKSRKLSEEFDELIRDELNVKNVVWDGLKTAAEVKVKIDSKVTPKLKAEGEARELVRAVQDLRKAQGLSVTDEIIVYAPTWPKDFEDYIKKETVAVRLDLSDQLKIHPIQP